MHKEKNNQMSRITRALLALPLAAAGLSLAALTSPASANTLASDTYCPSAIPIDVTSVPGVAAFKLVLQENPGPLALCVSLKEGSFETGGALVFTGGGVGVPSQDNQFTACQTVLVSQGNLGQQVIISSGSIVGEQWLCVQAGGTGVRVKIPTSGLPGVNWYGDDGSSVGTGSDPGNVGHTQLSKCENRGAVPPTIPTMCIRYY